MATQTAPPTGSTPSTPAKTLSKPSSSDRVVGWFNAHRQLTYWIGAIVAVAAVLFVWQLSTRRRSEDIASRELQGARYAYENQNLPLAASELARIVENYSGTNAAAEGRLLLANVRLQQGQPQQAIAVLQDWAPGAGRAFRAPAYGLLAAAHENMGRFREAAEAYEKGSVAARLDFMKAQMLSDAGRAWTAAADTAKAIADYRRIVKEFPKEGTVTEAKVRLGELTKGASS
jgi:tetratricopeptide (TPR) repeat protein